MKTSMARQSLGWSSPISKRGNIVAPVKLHTPADHLLLSKSEHNYIRIQKEERKTRKFLELCRYAVYNKFEAEIILRNPHKTSHKI